MTQYFASLSTLDLVALGIVVLNAVIGLLRGFAHQLTRLLVIFGGLAAARTLSGRLAPWLGERFPDLGGPASEVVAYFAILVCVLVIGAVLGYLLRNLIKSLKLESFDHFLGMILGLLKGVAIVIVAVLAASQLRGIPHVQDLLRNTESARLTSAVVTHIEPLFPAELRAKYQAWAGELPSGDAK